VSDTQPVSVSDIRNFYYCEFYSQLRYAFKKDIRTIEDQGEGNKNGMAAHEALLKIEAPVELIETIPEPSQEKYKVKVNILDDGNISAEKKPVRKRRHRIRSRRKTAPKIEIVQQLQEGDTIPSETSTIRQLQEQKITTLVRVGQTSYDIRGSPDAMIFDENIPLLVSEFKFKMNPYHVLVIERHEAMQARTYAWMLDKNNYNVSDLYYNVIKASIGCKGCEKLFDPIRDFIDGGRDLHYVCKCDDNGMENIMVSYLHKHNYHQTNKRIKHALPRIVANKPAKPTKHRSKCNACTVNQNCAYV